jgi:hypothetical protein
MNWFSRFAFYSQGSTTRQALIRLLAGSVVLALLAAAGYFVLQLFGSPAMVEPSMSGSSAASSLFLLE